MSPSTAGANAFKKKGDEWTAQQKIRKARAARQKAAREALAYPDAPNGLTAEALVAYHRQLKADCLRRMSERSAA